VLVLTDKQLLKKKKMVANNRIKKTNINFYNFMKKTTIKKKVLSQKERSELIKKGYEQIQQLSKKLKKHTKRNENLNHINYKIHYLLHDPFTFVNAYTKISKNKGALTEGYDDDNIMEYFGLTQAKKIAKQIKKGTYKFKPVKRTWVPKPGKSSKRPIDVPTQSNRIVQEAIRGILEAIYEPVFIEQGEKTKNLSNNYGFRPKHSTWTALDKLNKHSKKCTLVIEGDVESAYNNVDHDILINILKERIKDKKFLSLIKDMLKSGIMNDQKFEHSLNGTPQGGIVSPLLFNIYMLKFDEYIYEEFITPVLEENKKKKKELYQKNIKKQNITPT
jgi:retron-type reverse transcriptase